MIKEIDLSGKATYSNGSKFKFEKVNFIFGSNGSGKTTFSDQLRKNDSSKIAKIEGKVKLFVFNRYYIKDNFEFDRNGNGSFVLGKGVIKKLERIEKLEQEISSLCTKLKEQELETIKIGKKHLKTINDREDYYWKVYKDKIKTFGNVKFSRKNTKRSLYELISPLVSMNGDIDFDTEKSVTWKELKKLQKEFGLAKVEKNKSTSASISKKFDEQIYKYIALVISETFEAKNKSNKKHKTLLEINKDMIAKINSEISKKRNTAQQISEGLETVPNMCDKINGMLDVAQIKSFKVRANKNSKWKYDIIRDDEQPAFDTLSEGEQNLLAFLYYYCTVDTDVKPRKNQFSYSLIIDDPISSLDSSSVYMVSTLVRKLVKKCDVGNTKICQITVLTHNIDFYRLITLTRCNSKVNFGLIKKLNNISTITASSSNLVKNSYNELWRELLDCNTFIGIKFNLMRRIMEHYFKIICALPDIPAPKGEYGEERKNAWFSTVNDGSHSISDDLLGDVDEETYSKAFDTFKEIFIDSGNVGHLEAMLNLAKNN